jgi:hypothetical protein
VTVGQWSFPFPVEASPGLSAPETPSPWPGFLARSTLLRCYPVSSPVLAAGVPPMSSPDLHRSFQPSPATPDPPATASASSLATSPLRRGNAGHRAAKPRVSHRSHPSHIQRFGSAEISRVFALCPWAPPVSVCTP